MNVTASHDCVHHLHVTKWQISHVVRMWLLPGMFHYIIYHRKMRPHTPMMVFLWFFVVVVVFIKYIYSYYIFYYLWIMKTSLKIHTKSQVNHVFKEGTPSLGRSDMAEKNPICNLTVESLGSSSLLVMKKWIMGVQLSALSRYPVS